MLLWIIFSRLSAGGVLSFAIGDPMTLPDWKDIAGIFPSTATPPPTVLVAGFCLAAMVGGLWAYRRYRAKQSSYADIETSAEISFLGQQDNFWIVELKAILNNKAKAQRKISQIQVRPPCHPCGRSDRREQEIRRTGQFRQRNCQGIVCTEGLCLLRRRPLGHGNVHLCGARSGIGHLPHSPLLVRLQSGLQPCDGKGGASTKVDGVARPARRRAVRGFQTSARQITRRRFAR